MRDPLVPPPFAIAVDCDGAEHWIEVIDGIPRAYMHGEEERVLHVFGGELPPCTRYADAVRLAPWSVYYFEDLNRQLHGQTSSATAIWTQMGPKVREKMSEPVFDVTELPPQFRRLGMLRIERQQMDGLAPGAARARIEELIKKYAAVLLADATALIGVRFEIGKPGVDVVASPIVRSIIRLPLDWLSTVLVLGFEKLGPHLTLGVEFHGDGTMTETRLVPGSVGWAATQLRGAVPSNIKLLTEAKTP